MTNSKLQLNLHEANKLKFLLQIESNQGELSDVTPNIRFTINEDVEDGKANKGWIFGLTKENINQDQITIEIPPMKGIAKEGKSYKGKLEVILGPNYFVPSETEIEFIEPIKVEAKMTENKPILRESFRVKSQMHPKPIQAKSARPLLDSKKKLNESFIAECKKFQIDEPFEILESQGNEVLKKFIKDIFATTAKSFNARQKL